MTFVFQIVWFPKSNDVSDEELPRVSPRHHPGKVGTRDTFSILIPLLDY